MDVLRGIAGRGRARKFHPRGWQKRKKRFVRQSWQAACENAPCGVDGVGDELLRRFFASHPGFVQLFNFRCARLLNSAAWRLHARSVARAIDDFVVVATAGADPSSSSFDNGAWRRTKTALRELGGRHLVAYKVTPAHYDAFGRALLATVEATARGGGGGDGGGGDGGGGDGGGDGGFDRETLAAWTETWEGMRELMLQGPKVSK